MWMVVFRFIYFLLSVSLLSFLWGKYISLATQTWFALSLVVVFLFYQLWNIQRLKLLLQKLVKNWRQKIEAAQIQQDKFIQAIQASPNGILMLDELDQIEWCNHVSEMHFGIHSKRDTLQKVTFLIRKPLFVSYINQKDFTKPIDLVGMGQSGELTLLVQIFPYGDRRKLLLSQDVTQFHKNEAMRRDFIANVSHELRTPLTVLSGFLETVRELNLTDEDRQRYLNLMHVQSQRMESLVADLLVLSRLESSIAPPVDKLIEVKSMLQRLIEDAQNLSGGRHEIEYRHLSNLNIFGEEREIFSAFSNLITNAVRYTPDHGKILVQWKDIPEGGVEFSVTDSGLGIAAEHIPRLTERFYRIDRSRSRETGGTGLGLAIVKHVVSRHGGALNIQSELGQGATFSISFPSTRVQG